LLSIPIASYYSIKRLVLENLSSLKLITKLICWVLTSCQAFKNTEVDDLKALASLMPIEHYASGDILHQEGQTREIFAVINSENVGISRTTGHQEHKTLITFGREDVISESLLVE
jgi:hypothetical protein